MPPHPPKITKCARKKCDECGSRWLLGWPTASAHLDMSTCLSSACSFIIFCTSSLIIMPVKYMREIMENFQAFCNQTSLHGWQYITQRPETDGFWAGFKHIFWSIIVCVAMGCAAIFLYSNTIDFMNATVVTTVDTMTVPLSEVFFPSVVVCNINQVRKSFFAELGIYENETFIRQVYTDFILGKANHTSENFEVSARKRAVHEQIMKEYLAKHNETLETKMSITWFTHQDCKDMFLLSKWNQTKTYDYAIERDFGTDYGICCWYTPQLNFTQIDLHTHENHLHEPDWGHWFMNVPKGSKTGKDNGFTMLFDIESFDYSYFNEGSEGLKLALVHHLDMPIMRQKGFHIAPGTENQIAVTPTLMSTSANAMARFTSEQRDCYSEDEISLKFLPKDHGYRYEMSNCLFEAAFENILERCKCAPGEFDHVDYNGKQTKCRSACEDQVNSLFVTTSSYPNRKTLIYREEFCIITKRLIKKCKSYKRKPLDREYPDLCNLIAPLEYVEFCPNDEWTLPKSFNCTNNDCPVVEAILDYSKDNLVMFNIFIKDPYAKRFMKDEKITKTAYIANSGGLLGLCMGFSLVSAAEILYHCLFGLFSPICGRGKKNNKDTLYRVYTYSRDLENGLCDRHKKAEIVRLSEFQKQETTSLEDSYKDMVPGHRPGHQSLSPEPELIAETELPADRLLSGSYPGHLNRPCLLHNGVMSSCPAHGPSITSATITLTPSNGVIPNSHNNSTNITSNKYSFSPERVI